MFCQITPSSTPPSESTCQVSGPVDDLATQVATVLSLDGTKAGLDDNPVSVQASGGEVTLDSEQPVLETVAKGELRASESNANPLDNQCFDDVVPHFFDANAFTNIGPAGHSLLSSDHAAFSRS